MVLVVACAGIASAYGATTLLPPLQVAILDSFKPTKLPRNHLTPIHLKVEGTVNTTDGTHPPALSKVIGELGKNAAIDTKGLPACKVIRITAVEMPTAANACKLAQVGKGEMEVEVEFAESPPFIAKSKLLAFNGGVKGGVRTIYLYAFLKNPVSAAVVTTVKVKKIHKSHFGTKLIISLPTIAGGSGSVRKLKFEFFRTFVFKDEKRSFISAKCTDGKLQARWEAKFADGSLTTDQVIQPCTLRD